MAAVVVALLDELQLGRGRLFERDGKEYAVWLLPTGEVHVLDNVCLHVGGPLADGFLEDGCVTCPWHGWTYELASGRRRTAAGLVDGVGSYRVWIEGHRVWADLP